jgi:hypothetical protein
MPDKTQHFQQLLMPFLSEVISDREEQLLLEMLEHYSS